ncbi:hypothetical protein FACS189461_4860 [Spirochaetia bacterium]|nr:hypothetical protein FACS189461_4860 [Spirochaetia bacterium]
MNPKAYLVPMCIFYLNGNRLNVSFEGPLRSVRVLDRLNRPSECTLTFDYGELSDKDTDLFQFFSWLTVQMGYKDNMREVFAGEITATEAHLPGYGPQ